MTLPVTTRAAVLYQPNEPLGVEELQIPPLEDGQLLVRMAFSGICQTQLLEARGKKGPDKFLPHTMGHEGSGEVLAIGPGVSKVKPGDSVVLSWIKGNGIAAAAPKYRNQAGQVVNAGPVATFSEYAVVAENRCVRIPKEVSLKAAALLGCAVPTGTGIVLRELALRPGESLAVVGTGGIGLSAILAAKLLNCFPIIAIDIKDDKLHFAKEMGATHTLHARNEKNIAEKVFEIQKGGVDAAIEASGNSQAMEMAYTLIRPEGGRLMIAGNLAHGETIRIDPFQLIRGKQLMGSVGGATQIDRDLPHYAHLYQEGKFPIDKLATKTFRLSDINAALATLESGCVGRLLIEF